MPDGSALRYSYDKGGLLNKIAKQETDTSLILLTTPKVKEKIFIMAIIPKPAMITTR